MLNSVLVVKYFIIQAIAQGISINLSSARYSRLTIFCPVVNGWIVRRCAGLEIISGIIGFAKAIRVMLLIFDMILFTQQFGEVFIFQFQVVMLLFRPNSKWMQM